MAASSASKKHGFSSTAAIAEEAESILRDADAYFKFAASKLPEEGKELSVLLDRKYHDPRLTADLTKAVREFLGSDSLIVTVLDGEKYSSLHRHSLSLSAGIFGGYPDRGSGKVDISIDCTRAAALILRILGDPKLVELREGLMLAFQHEIGHAKLFTYARSMGFDHPGSEMMAQLYAISRLERGDGENAIRAMAKYATIAYYADPRHDMGHVVSQRMFRHWRGTPIPEAAGPATFRYMGDAKAEARVARLARRYFMQMVTELGDPRYSPLGCITTSKEGPDATRLAQARERLMKVLRTPKRYFF